MSRMAKMSVAGVALAALFAVSAVTESRAHASRPPILTVNAFTANPGQVLQQNPNGGPALVTVIQDLAVADPTALPVIMNLLKDANADQKSAIGTALAQAAKIVILTNQAYAAQIQQAIAQNSDPALVLAFTNALGDVRLGGVGAGLGGGGAGIGGQTTGQPGGVTGGTGSPVTFGEGSAGTNPFTFTSSVTGTSSPSGGGTTTTSSTTITSSVSF